MTARTGTRTLHYTNTLHNRDLAYGYAPTYLPLQLIPARTYQETFNLSDAPTPDTPDETTEIPFTAHLYAQDTDPHTPTLTTHLQRRGNTLLLNLTPAETTRFYATLDRGHKIGEWRITPGPLATGPVSFRKPPGEHPRLPQWVCITPFQEPVKQLEIILKGTDKGEYQPGITYSPGDLVTLDGRSFYALCQIDGTPGSGPNLDPNDPDSNTLLPNDFPPADTDPGALAAE